MSVTTKDNNIIIDEDIGDCEGCHHNPHRIVYYDTMMTTLCLDPCCTCGFITSYKGMTDKHFKQIKQIREDATQ